MPSHHAWGLSRPPGVLWRVPGTVMFPLAVTSFLRCSIMRFSAHGIASDQGLCWFGAVTMMFVRALSTFLYASGGEPCPLPDMADFLKRIVEGRGWRP